jgi:hypothetical protein
VRDRLQGFLRILFLDAWRLWLFLAFTAVILWLPTYITDDRAASTRWSGITFELIGLIVVAYGIHDTRQLFGKPGLWTYARRWFARLRGVFRRPILLSAHGIGSAFASGSLSVEGSGHVARREPTLEERVQHLEARLTSLDARFTTLDDRLSEEVTELRQSHQEEVQARERKDREIAELLDRYSTGGLNLDVIGLVWVAVGSVLAGFPGEIADLLQRL